MYPMLVRDVLLTLASHEFFTPKWSPTIRDEWTRNLVERLRAAAGVHEPEAKIARITAAMAAAFPDAEVTKEVPHVHALEAVDPKDRHVVMTALAAHADAIVTFNMSDFAADHLCKHLQLEVIHPDDFVLDLINLNEKRAVAAFRELRARKKHPPWEIPELAHRLSESGLVQTSLWVGSQDVSALL